MGCPLLQLEVRGRKRYDTYNLRLSGGEQKEGVTLQDNIIEFNGKRYDAVTGKLLGKSHEKVDGPLVRPATAPGRTIDGIVRPSEHPKKTTKHHTAHKDAKDGRTERHPGKTLKPHHPQSAKTLMRRAVHKPDVTKKPSIKPQAPAEIMAKPASSIAVKHSAHHVDPVRKHRADQVQKSGSVRRFTDVERHDYTAPGHVVRPVVHSAPVREHAVHQPAARPKADVFEAAIARANSHEQPPHEHHARKHRKKNRLTGVVAGIAAFLILGGFFAYLNMPKIELKIASINAGFGANLPSYSPTGYELADVKNRPGKVTLSFRSGERNYQLIQQPSNWTSQTLADDIIASAGHETIESSGRIIYIYDGVATWLSGDVRYDLTGNAELGKDEIAAIAAST